MKQLVTIIFLISFLGTCGQSAQIRHTLEFQFNTASATVANFGVEGRYAYRLNRSIALWNWEVFGGAGLWGRSEQLGVHGLGGLRAVFGKRRHQVLGDLGAVYLLTVSEGRTSYAQPLLDLGYRYTAKTDDWHIQLTAGTWGIVSLNLGLKW